MMILWEFDYQWHSFQHMVNWPQTWSPFITIYYTKNTSDMNNNQKQNATWSWQCKISVCTEECVDLKGWNQWFQLAEYSESSSVLHTASNAYSQSTCWFGWTTADKTVSKHKTANSVPQKNYRQWSQMQMKWMKMQWSCNLLKKADRQSGMFFSSQLLGAADICDYMVRISFFFHNITFVSEHFLQR